MTGQFTLFFTLLAHDVSWVQWTGPLQAEVQTGKLATALRVNSDQLGRYLDWLVNHGYVEIVAKTRGKLTIRFTQFSHNFLATSRPESLLPSQAERRGELSGSSRRGGRRSK